MQELHRILEPGGVLYPTTHGRPLTLHLPDLTTAFDADDLVVLREKLAGDNLCTTFQSFGYTKNTLLTDSTCSTLWKAVTPTICDRIFIWCGRRGEAGSLGG